MVATVSLNAFLRKLPELVVDNLLFIRDDRLTEFYITNGTWKLRKLGYNEYAMRKRVEPKFAMRKRVEPKFVIQNGSWHSGTSAGDIRIQKVSISLEGVIVTLGDDVLDGEN
jgi:hypothetical protein